MDARRAQRQERTPRVSCENREQLRCYTRDMLDTNDCDVPGRVREAKTRVTFHLSQPVDDGVDEDDDHQTS